MIFGESIVNVVDNSGVIKVKCINGFKKNSYKKVQVGDFFIGVVKSFRKAKKIQMKKGSIVNCLLIRSMKEVSLNVYHTGFYSKSYAGNDCILVQRINFFVPLGSRVQGYSLYKVKQKKINKILMLSKKVI